MTLAAAPIAVFMPLTAGDDLTGRDVAVARAPAAAGVPRAGE
jgi:hypothetical protein